MWFVCLWAYLRNHISKLQFFVYAACVHGWWHCNTLCTYGRYHIFILWTRFRHVTTTAASPVHHAWANIVLVVSCHGLESFIQWMPGVQSAVHSCLVCDMKIALCDSIVISWCHQCMYDVVRSGVVVPGNCQSVARQFLRCVLHQLAPNNVFPQIFMSSLRGLQFCHPVHNAV